MAPVDPPVRERRLPLVGRVAIVFAATLAIWMLAVALRLHVYPGEVPVGVRLAHAVAVGALGIALVVVARAKLDRRPFSGLGLELSRRAWHPFLAGLSAFLIPSLVGFGIAGATGAVTLTAAEPLPGFLGSVAILIVAVFAYEALPEELIFRGYLFRNLETAMAPWVAAVVQAVLFTVLGTTIWVVGAGWGVLGERFPLFLVMGLFLGVVRILSGSVWAGVGFHLGFQCVAQSIGGTLLVVSGPGVLVGIVPGFVFGATIVLLVMRRRPNWTRPVPDPA